MMTPTTAPIQAALVSVERLHLALPEERGDTMTATVRHLTILELEAGLDLSLELGGVELKRPAVFCDCSHDVVGHA